MARVTWTDPAVEQLQEIVAYVAEHSAAKADEINTRILTAVDMLAQFPMLGRVVPEFKLEYLRELIQKPYRILYVVREDVCSVVAVLHGSRNLTAHFDPADLEDDESA